MNQPTLDEFRDQALAFLDGNAARKADARATRYGEGSDHVGLFEEKSEATQDAELAAAKSWRAKADDEGVGWVAGPEPDGGAGPPPVHRPPLHLPLIPSARTHPR